MASLTHVALLSLLLCVADGKRADSKLLESQVGESTDCSWAKLDTSTGWGCETIKSFSGGMQGNTKLVLLFPPGGKPFKAVLKEMNSNENPMGLNSLENERKIAAFLMDAGFKKMPAYYLDLKVKPEFTKYANSETMTIGQKRECDGKRSNAGICKINPAWDNCNGNRGNIDTTKEIPRSRIRTEGLKCPDTQLLAMEFLDGYADLKALQPRLSAESGFQREVRAAALFLAFDQMNKAGVSHCDFNPGNAMFKKDDPRFAKIIDFGLARLHDYPTGACRGNLEDIGSPGYLWLSLYRGQRDATEFSQNDRKAGPWSLSGNAQFETPSGKMMKPFSFMRGKFMGKGGVKPWNKETRQNWPGIVAYARVLLKEAGGFFDDAKPFIPVVGKPKPTLAPTTPPRQEKPVDNHQPKPEDTSGGSGAPKCSSVYADRFGPCRLSLYDRSPCLVTVKCPYSGQVITKVISQADAVFGGRIEIADCNNCDVKR